MEQMRWFVLVVVVLSSLLSAAAVQGAAAEQPARDLIARLLLKHAGQFVVETIPLEGGRDVFEIEGRDGRIVLRGSSGVAIASALNWYLKYTCNCQISWCGDQLKLPDMLPAVNGKIRRATPYSYRYAFNYCTFGYYMAFWDWARWEREIDLMALNGINAPLAATGTEVVYRNVYREMGLPEKDITSFMAGPPYYPWFLMGNIDGWGGPVSEAWYARQEALQKKIVARERELGMKPILPAFGGHVPSGLKGKFPNAQVDHLRSWGGFPGVFVLSPTDPLFKDIGMRFIRETKKLYGTDHLYSADTFNEVDPPSTDPAYLKGMANSVYQSMAGEDAEAVWVMQGWLFLFSERIWKQPRIEALLSGVPDDRMLILDLYSDGKPQWKKTRAFCGKPWLWCIVHSWGGKQGMYGRLEEVGEGLPKALKDAARGKLCGIGTTNEGNDVNPIVFDQMYEMAWHDRPMDTVAWVRQYVTRRYGKDNAKAQQAWDILRTELYNCRDNRHGPQGSFLAMPPTLAEKGGGFVRGDIFYNSAKIREAFRLLLDAADELGSQETYRFDLVDLGRQVMSDLSQQHLHKELREAFSARNATRYAAATTKYLQAIQDTDRLLRTHAYFQLGRYLQPAKSAGAVDRESAQHERNARRLITLWGDRNSPLSSYAQRQYGGLMGDFNLACWKLYLNAAGQSLRGRGKFNAGAADAAVRAYTEQWIWQNNEYPIQAQGDAVAEAKMIYDKYCIPLLGRKESAGSKKQDLKHHE